MVAATETKIINGRAAGTPSPMLPRIVTADVPLVGNFDLLATLALHVSEQQYLQLYTQSIVRSLLSLVWRNFLLYTFTVHCAEYLYTGAGMHRLM